MSWIVQAVVQTRKNSLLSGQPKRKQGIALNNQICFMLPFTNITNWHLFQVLQQIFTTATKIQTLQQGVTNLEMNMKSPVK